ncbi:MAG TPA: carboxypeptidase-like regulatory domain-containing protein, partial [Bacteroidia bacterium]|nr:carboxypeptidase-like regulatory domain-containing protein [Bacteroidia bacterium]
NGSAMTGNLKGHIYQYDQYGAVILTGLTGIHDSLSPGHVALTDSNGYYVFNGLAAGDYNFTIAKAGYGTNLVQSLQLVGGGDIYRDVKIAQIPNFNVSAVTVTNNTTTGNIDFVGTVTSDTRGRSAILYLGKTGSVSAVPASFSNSYTGTIRAAATTFTVSVNPNDIHDLGIPTGSTVYCALYGAATTFASASSYQDYATGHTIYTAISATPATGSMVMP